MHLVGVDDPGRVIAALASASASASAEALAEHRRLALDAAHRCVDLLVRTAVLDAVGPTWPTWESDQAGRALGCRGGRRAFGDGDAGIVWALGLLGAALGRPDATDLSVTGAAGLLDTRPAGASDASDGSGVVPGLMRGEAGVDLLARVGGRIERWWSSESDLADGLAGVLLSLARSHRHEEHAAAIITELGRRATVESWGSSWPSGPSAGAGGRPLCGLANGGSGLAWALVEAAAVWPSLAPAALELADGALRWEAAWDDADRGSWPDLSHADVVWPDLWCHGAAGAGAVRLRVLELAAAGLEVPWALDSTRAQAEVAVQRCGRALVVSTRRSAEEGTARLPGGWSLCRGTAGPAAVIALAADVFGVPEHRDQALAAAAAFVMAAPDNPELWPAGLTDADGDLSLAHGVAGTALVLTDLARAGTVPSPALLGLGGVRSAGGPGPGVVAAAGG